jgi:hypothetical protein
MIGARTWLLAAVLGLAAVQFAAAGGDAAAELAALEKKFEEWQGPAKDRYAGLRPQFEEFAKAHAGTDAGLRAKLWLLQYAWYLKDEKGSMQDTAAKLADEILAEYPGSDGLAPIADWYYVFRPEKYESVLGALAAPERTKPVRAAAAFANAVRLQRAGRKDDAALRFTEIAKDYGGLAKGYTTYAALADAYLHPHDPADLDIGKSAPEIVGNSPDGKAMKLSDFKGRVVVVDFFGDW